MSDRPAPDPGGRAGPDAREPLRVRLMLPYAAPHDALRGNYRSSHWGGRSKASAEVRADVMMLGRSKNLHRVGPISHITVQLVWAPGDRRDRDADNLWPLLKACCDGLARGNRNWIGLDLVPKDTPAWMTKPSPLILPPPDKGMWLDLTILLAAGPT